MPFICCSMTCVTVSSRVLAEAPAYVALICTEGGAMGGYCDTGSVVIDNAPAIIRIMAITHAKMGRSIKKLTMKDRKSVVSGKSVSVRVDLGGRRIIKKQKKK